MAADKRRCEPLGYDALVRMFPRATDRAGVRDAWLTPHSLRHTHASLAEGVPITEVSRWLGHKSIEVAHQICGHLVPSSFDRARTVLDAANQKTRQPPRNASASSKSRTLQAIQRIVCSFRRQAR